MGSSPKFRYTHPFEDEKIYGKSQKEKLQELKEQLQNLEESPLRRGR